MVEFEKIAINLAKENNMSLAEAKSFLNKVYTYKAFAELVGAVRAGTALNYAGAKLPKGANANEALPVVGKTKGYENQDIRISNGAENIALYPKLKEQLIKESFKGIASQDSRLQAVYDGLNKGLNYGIKGIISSSESDRLGRLWVGEGYSEVRNPKGEIIGYNSQDKLRGYRIPSKKNSPYAETGIQSNFETYRINPITNEKEKIGNAHFNIKD